MVKIVGGWSCTECLYSSKYTTDVRRHIESKHMQEFKSCEACAIEFPSFNQYKQHFIVYHKKL